VGLSSLSSRNNRYLVIRAKTVIIRICTNHHRHTKAPEVAKPEQIKIGIRLSVQVGWLSNVYLGHMTSFPISVMAQQGSR
jgi:hypothetical protein